MHLTREQAKALGLADLWPTRAPAQEGDGMNKLERAFFELAEKHFGENVARESLKLRLAGRTFYTPDFVSSVEFRLTCWEVKGFMRDDASVKLKVAARLHPYFFFVLVTRRKQVWECRTVTNRGIGPEIWCPYWLA